MKRGQKIIIRVALAVTATGFLLTLGALAAAKFDFSRIDPYGTASAVQTVQPSASTSPQEGQAYTFVTQTVEGSFTGIDVDAQACRVRLIPSEKGQCQVEYPTHPQMTCSVSVEQDTLCISFRDERPGYSHITDPLRPLEILLYLPQKEYEALELETNSGDVQVPSDFSFAQAKVETDSGQLKFAAGVSGPLTLRSVSGNVEVTGVSPEALQVHSTSGALRLSNLAVQGSCSLDSVSGNVTLTDCDADDLHIETTSGDVSASLRSPKAFSAHTVSGRVSVPSDTSGGPCNITTISGSITCTIE